MEIEVETEIKNLEKLSLSTLRKLGRECGVKAPTALKKKELITEIKCIKTGLLFRTW